MELLTGKQLLDGVDSLGGSNIRKQAIACGYSSESTLENGEKVIRSRHRSFIKAYRSALIKYDRMEDLDVFDSQIAENRKGIEEQANLWKQQNPERWKEFQQILEESKGMVQL